MDKEFLSKANKSQVYARVRKTIFEQHGLDIKDLYTAETVSLMRDMAEDASRRPGVRLDALNEMAHTALMDMIMARAETSTRDKLPPTEVAAIVNRTYRASSASSASSSSSSSSSSESSSSGSYTESSPSERVYYVGPGIDDRAAVLTKAPAPPIVVQYHSHVVVPQEDHDSVQVYLTRKDEAPVLLCDTYTGFTDRTPYLVKQPLDADCVAVLCRAGAAFTCADRNYLCAFSLAVPETRTSTQRSRQARRRRPPPPPPLPPSLRSAAGKASKEEPRRQPPARNRR